MAARVAAERTAMSNSASDAGFTLIELLVALAVMALLAVLLVPQLGHRPPLSQPDEARVAGVLASMRLEAQREGRAMSPDIARVAQGATWQPGYPANTSGPRFNPDGSAHGGVLTLGDGRTLTISWIDGHVRARR